MKVRALELASWPSLWDSSPAHTEQKRTQKQKRPKNNQKRAKKKNSNIKENFRYIAVCERALRRWKNILSRLMVPTRSSPEASSGVTSWLYETDYAPGSWRGSKAKGIFKIILCTALTSWVYSLQQHVGDLISRFDS